MDSNGKTTRNATDIAVELARESMPHLLEASEGPALRFTIPGEPKGFLVARSKRHHTKALTAMRLWKLKCCQHLAKCGLRLPLYCDVAYPLWIGTSAYYEGNVHCDPQNTSKGLIDALFRGTNGPGDKHAAGAWDKALYDAKRPRVLVEIRGWMLRQVPELISYSW